jgi:hypothetical protein
MYDYKIMLVTLSFGGAGVVFPFVFSCPLDAFFMPFQSLHNALSPLSILENSRG